MYIICLSRGAMATTTTTTTANSCKTKIKRGACHVRVQQVKLCFLFRFFLLSKKCCRRINFNFCLMLFSYCFFLFNERLLAMSGIFTKKRRFSPICKSISKPYTKYPSFIKLLQIIQTLISRAASMIMNFSFQ